MVYFHSKYLYFNDLHREKVFIIFYKDSVLIGKEYSILSIKSLSA